MRKTSHKAAEQKRRDSLKASFDELRLLLPPINIEALDPESGEPIPGSSAPRLLPKSSLVPDDNPNKGVSKVALLKFSNDYIGRIHTKIERRENYIDLLKEAIRSLRSQAGLEKDGSVDELLSYEFEDEEDDEIAPSMTMGNKGKERDQLPGEGGMIGPADDEYVEEDEIEGDQPQQPSSTSTASKRKNSRNAKPVVAASASRPKASSKRNSTATTPKLSASRASNGSSKRGSTASAAGMSSSLNDSPALLALNGRNSYGQDDIEMV